MKHYKTLGDLHRENGWPPPEHPLFSIMGCQPECRPGNRPFTSDCYLIGFKKFRSGSIRYGRTAYDHHNGSLIFVKPQQIVERKEVSLQEKGFMIIIHKDYLNGHELHQAIQHYGFFDYEVNEALHLSPAEERMIWDLHDKINQEYRNNPDEFSREIILSHLASILKYAQRYYKRQFINRKDLSVSTVTRFHEILKAYYKNGNLKDQGMPSVKELAEKLDLSARYLCDLLKQETGKTAMELIHISLVSEAQNLFDYQENGMTEIAYQPGIENLSYFSSLFKKQTNMAPLVFSKISSD